MTLLSRPPVPLHALCERLAGVAWTLEGDGHVGVGDVRSDSRRVQAGDLFAARSGTRVDASRFVHEAVARGAVAVLAARGAHLPDVPVPVLRVPDVDAVLGRVAEEVWGRPSEQLDVVGITGTNGKTTTAWLVARALTAAGSPAARLGTLGYDLGDDRESETLTTPAADDLARFLARAQSRGAERFVMEVSSHALAQRRVDGIRFAVAAFTNLTQDHLDYHASMEAYGTAKARLFDELSPGAAVINVDDAFGKELCNRALTARCTRIGRGPENDVFPVDVTLDRDGVRGRFRSPDGELTLVSRLVGRHNLYNLMVALGVGLALGMPGQPFADALGSIAGVPGRLERCDAPGDDVVVLVDYAHTPDALVRVLEAARALTRNDVICVFGCGGDRDPGKRPQMGEAVGRAADRAIVTTDNPRTEEPGRIAAAVVDGLAPTRTAYTVELDRARAIERAILDARPGDVVLIAGKGHEPYQIVGNERRAFDDRDQARRAMAARREGRS
jgi:UDP-N-acetylmuramoyl-L-alanyl-D-glutamate--2,6-diaminopimelate ligase